MAFLTIEEWEDDDFTGHMEKYDLPSDKKGPELLDEATSILAQNLIKTTTPAFMRRVLIKWLDAADNNPMGTVRFCVSHSDKSLNGTEIVYKFRYVPD